MEVVAPSHLSLPPRRRRRGSRVAVAALLIALFLLLRLADAWSWRASYFVESGGWPWRVALVSSALWTTALLAVVWRRRAWARHLVIPLLLAGGAICAIAAFRLVAEPMAPGLSFLSRPFPALLFAALAYLAAGLVFIRSRSLRHLAERTRES